MTDAELFELARETTSKYVSPFQVRTDTGTRTITNIEMHAILAWEREKHDDPNYLAQLAAAWATILGRTTQCNSSKPTN